MEGWREKVPTSYYCKDSRSTTSTISRSRTPPGSSPPAASTNLLEASQPSIPRSGLFVPHSPCSTSSLRIGTLLHALGRWASKEPPRTPTEGHHPPGSRRRGPLGWGGYRSRGRHSLRLDTWCGSRFGNCSSIFVDRNEERTPRRKVGKEFCSVGGTISGYSCGGGYA